MKKLLFGLLFLMIAGSAWGANWATTPPADYKIINIPMTTAETIYTMVLTTDAYSGSTLTVTGGSIVTYDLIARLGDIQWLESNLATAEYKTIKQDVCDSPNMPVNIAKDTKWYFKSASNIVSLEAQVWHYIKGM